MVASAQAAGTASLGGRVGRASAAVVAIVALATPALVAQGELEVRDVSPRAHSLRAGADASIVVDFDRPVQRESVSERTFWAFGRWSGTASGRFRFSNGDRTVELDPDRRFSAGEMVTVFLSHDLQAADGGALRRAGYSFQFWVRSRGVSLDFREIDRFSTRSDPTLSTRSYGGFGSDLDGDGSLDLTVVNEDTNDLRTYLNRGDRSGLLGPALEPPRSVGAVPSPSEPSDFNGDGNTDVVVANTRGASLSVLLGRGDGTFSPPRTLAVGGEPRGVAVLDADGDGDVDVAATSFAEGRVIVLFNDGEGRFGRARSFGSGDGEWALAAGDMDDDGILDLVVGAQTAAQVRVYLGNGDGSFRLAGRRDSGGATWMLVLGDLDEDGAEDVAVVNSESDNGAILSGDGRGQLAAATISPTDGFPLATDLADLDGDGDLDWITSSFFGDWQIFENNGRGAFSRRARIAAPEAASCSVPMDLDGDGALDLALIDELADEVILMLADSRGAGFFSDFETGDTSEWSRSRGAVEVVSPGLRGSDHALRVAVDGTSARSFVESRRPVRQSSWSVSFELAANRVALGGQRVEIARLGQRQATLHLEEAAGRYRVSLVARDAGGPREIGSVKVPVSKAVSLRVEWAAASSDGAADGRAVLSKNGQVRAAAFDLDNFSRVVNRVRIGLPGGSAGTSGGGFLVDDYASSP